MVSFTSRIRRLFKGGDRFREIIPSAEEINWVDSHAYMIPVSCPLPPPPSEPAPTPPAGAPRAAPTSQHYIPAPDRVGQGQCTVGGHNRLLHCDRCIPYTTRHSGGEGYIDMIPDQVMQIHKLLPDPGYPTKHVKLQFYSTETEDAIEEYTSFEVIKEYNLQEEEEHHIQTPGSPLPKDTELNSLLRHTARPKETSQDPAVAQCLPCFCSNRNSSSSSSSYIGLNRCCSFSSHDSSGHDTCDDSTAPLCTGTAAPPVLPCIPPCGSTPSAVPDRETVTSPPPVYPVNWSGIVD